MVSPLVRIDSPSGGVAAVAVVVPAQRQPVGERVVGELRVAVDPEVLAGQGQAADLLVEREVEVGVDDRVAERAAVVGRAGHHGHVPVVEAVAGQRRALGALVRDVDGAVAADLRVGALRERSEPAGEGVQGGVDPGERGEAAAEVGRGGDHDRRLEVVALGGVGEPGPAHVHPAGGLVGGQPDLVVEERGRRRRAGRVGAVELDDRRAGPVRATVPGDRDDDAARRLGAAGGRRAPAEHDVAVVDGVARPEGEHRVAGRVHRGERAGRAGRDRQPGQHLVLPGLAAVEAGVRPAGAVVALLPVDEDAVVVGAGHDVARVGRVDRDRGLVLRAAAAGLAADRHGRVADDLVDVRRRVPVRVGLADEVLAERGDVRVVLALTLVLLAEDLLEQRVGHPVPGLVGVLGDPGRGRVDRRRSGGAAGRCRGGLAQRDQRADGQQAGGEHADSAGAEAHGGSPLRRWSGASLYPVRPIRLAARCVGKVWQRASGSDQAAGR